MYQTYLQNELSETAQRIDRILMHYVNVDVVEAVSTPTHQLLIIIGITFYQIFVIQRKTETDSRSSGFEYQFSATSRRLLFSRG